MSQSMQTLRGTQIVKGIIVHLFTDHTGHPVLDSWGNPKYSISTNNGREYIQVDNVFSPIPEEVLDEMPDEVTLTSAWLRDVNPRGGGQPFTTLSRHNPDRKNTSRAIMLAVDTFDGWPSQGRPMSHIEVQPHNMLDGKTRIYLEGHRPIAHRGRQGRAAQALLLLQPKDKLIVTTTSGRQTTYEVVDNNGVSSLEIVEKNWEHEVKLGDVELPQKLQEALTPSVG